MTGAPSFDVTQAHRYFSADCFNKTWQLIRKTTRTPAEDEQMIRLSQASLWHWTQRVDCTRANLSIGYWQLARVYAIAGRADEARRYSQWCLDHSRDESPFLHAYAFEALARAEQAGGNNTMAAQYRTEALRLSQDVADLEERNMILEDLKTIG